MSLSNTSKDSPELQELGSQSNSFPSKPQATASMNLEEFFTRAGLSPPTAASDIMMSDVQTAVDMLLCPISKYWSDLDDFQKAKMSFLVLRGQPRLLIQEQGKVLQEQGKALRNVARYLWDAVMNTNGLSFKRLEGFVQKGGDKKHLSLATADLDGKTISDYFGHFLEQHPEWSDPEAEAHTIFNHPDEFSRVKPLLLFQEGTSTVCFIASVANALFYSQCLHTGTAHEESVEHYALNFNRFMRNNCSNEELFGIIFMGKGGDPKKTLVNLLASFNKDVSAFDLIKKIDIEYGPEDGKAYIQFAYWKIKEMIRRYGALIVERFKIFPEFCENSAQLRFHGNYDDKEHYEESQCNIYHAVLVVGVRLNESKDGTEGLEFLVQNSWESKPFVIVGFDLLKSMGVDELVAVEEGLGFSSESNSFDNATQVIESGSPIHSEVHSKVLLRDLELDGVVWRLDNLTEASTWAVEGSAAAGPMPDYYDKIIPSDILYILS
jgi:hypothetical protein